MDVRFWSMDDGETVYVTHGILFPFDEHGGIVNIMDVDRCHGVCFPLIKVVGLSTLRLLCMLSCCRVIQFIYYIMYCIIIQ